MKNHIFEANLIETLVYTLLHSLWQGMLVFLILKLFLLFVSSPKYRYLWTVSSLSFFALISFSTFIYLLPSYKNAEISSGTFELLISDVYAHSQTIVFEEKSYFNELFAVWCIGVLFFSIRMMFGFYHVKTVVDSATELEWINGFAKLKEQFSIKRNVRLAESSRVSSPLTVGWLKPVILFPVGMLTGFNTVYLEAILAHELAHIKRHDYLVNILQLSAETIFFFNPFVWLISAAIRAEREFCCDELAAKFCNSNVAVVNALVAVANYQKDLELAMQFSMKKNQLVLRIKHILGMKRKKNYGFVVLFLVLGLFGGYLYAGSGSSEKLSVSSFFKDRSFDENTREEYIQLQKEIIDLEKIANEETPAKHTLDETGTTTFVLNTDSLGKDNEEEFSKLKDELKSLLKKVEENSVALPAIEIKRGETNSNVLSNLKESQSKAVVDAESNFEENVALWKTIEEKKTRLDELHKLRMNAFESNLNKLLVDIKANSKLNLDEDFRIRFKGNELHINDELQNISTFVIIKNLFVKNLGKEPFLEIGKWVEKSDIGISRTKYGLNMLIPSENNSTIHWPVRNLK